MRRAAIVGILAAVALIAGGLLWLASRPPAPAYVYVAPAAGDRSVAEGTLMASASADRSGAKPLAPNVQTVGTPETSFDGERVLFAGRQRGASFAQVWEVRRDGRGLKQITHENADCTEPHYLPDNKVVLTRGSGGSNALYTCTLEGEKLSRITSNVDPILQTTVLPDGRILGMMRSALVTVHSDGTGVATYTGAPEDLAAIRAEQARTLLPTRPRPIPTGHISVVDRQKRETGLLFCLNAYLSDRPGVQALPEGTIRKVRVWAAASAPRVLGEAPVERDGSFLLEVPSDTPLRFESLDARGQAVGGSCAWVWVRPNESRGCIGCHESRDLIPENHVQMAIKKKPFSLVSSVSKPAR